MSPVLPEVSGGSLVGLVLTALAVMGSPGPSTLSLVAVVGAYGLRAALPYCLGLVAGTTLVLLAVATGVTALLLAVPALRWVLAALSVGYVLWLAVRLARASTLSGSSSGGRSPSVTGGLVLGALNPKAWLAIGAVFSGARLADRAAVDGVVKVLLLTVVIVVVHVGWLFAGRLLEPVLRTPRRARAVNVALAALLVAATVPVLLP